MSWNKIMMLKSYVSYVQNSKLLMSVTQFIVWHSKYLFLQHPSQAHTASVICTHFSLILGLSGIRNLLWWISFLFPLFSPHLCEFREITRNRQQWWPIPKTCLAQGLILSASPLLMQNPAPPVANQNFTETWERRRPHETLGNTKH